MTLVDEVDLADALITLDEQVTIQEYLLVRKVAEHATQPLTIAVVHNMLDYVQSRMQKPKEPI